MTSIPITRRRALQLFGAAGVLAGVVGCGGNLGSTGGGGSGGRIKVGLLIPQAGVYAPLGTDMQRAWELYVEQSDGMLGGYEVETVIADEGEGPDTGVPAAQRLLQAEACDVITGIVSSAVALGVAPLVSEAGKLLLISMPARATSPAPRARRPSGGPLSQPRSRRPRWASTSPRPMSRTVSSRSPPDYAAGTETLAGFTEIFEAGGGVVVGSTLTPFGTTQDYQPFLSQIRSSGAKAAFVFFAGGEAVSFVQQYAAFGLKDSIPLYGVGFLTEGSVLDAQQDAALGVQTSLHYSTEIDNENNAAFVEAYRGAHDELPTCYAVQTWDAANVLNRALPDAADCPVRHSLKCWVGSARSRTVRAGRGASTGRPLSRTSTCVRLSRVRVF